jgi:hypothetical protein
LSHLNSKGVVARRDWRGRYSFRWGGELRDFVRALPNLCNRAWQSFAGVFCIFYPEGRQALLERARARTDLEVLAVEQKRMEIEFQRANNVIDLVQKVEKIKDSEVREKARAAISFSIRKLPSDQ